MARWLGALWLLLSCGDGSAPPRPDAPSTCDTTTQDCPDGGKCTYVDPEGDGLERGCVADGGTRALGEPCIRSAEGLGHDDCAPGLFCSFIGVLPPDAGGTRLCRAMCDADTPCPGTERCAIHVDEPLAGFCGEPCEPFAACPDAMTCGDTFSTLDGDLAFFLVCRVTGNVPLGAACSTNYDCGADAICLNVLGPGTCRALCDDAHPCTSPQQCMTPDGAVAGICLDG